MSEMKQFLDNSYLFGGNAPFIEDLYEKYLANPQSVPDEWREYFDRLQVLPGSTVKDVARAPVEQSFVERAKAIRVGDPAEATSQLGPLISEEQYQRVTGYIEEGKRGGARLALLRYATRPGERRQPLPGAEIDVVEVPSCSP